MSSEVYLYHAQMFCEHVLKRNDKKAPEMETENGIVIPISEDERIAYIPNELRFVLYRHWSVFESMYHSPFVATRLRTWKEAGRDSMKLLLASMGIRFDECVQQYENMQAKYRNEFLSQLKQYARKFKLDGVFFPSFLKFMSIKVQISASDMVYCMTAMLDSNNDQNFWNAYDALGGNYKLISKGIADAISLQQSMVSQVVSVMDHQTITKYKCFNYVCMNSVPENILRSHFTLTRMALFLQEALQQTQLVRQSNQGDSFDNPRVPLILAINNEASNTYLLIGISPDRVTNKLGMAFRKANESANAHLANVGFETAIVEISSESLTDFIEAVYFILQNK
jgi:cell division control protein 45